MIQKLKCCLLFWRQISPNYLGKSQIEERTKKKTNPTSHTITPLEANQSAIKFKLVNRTFFVNKQLTLFFNYLKNSSLNFAQNFRECSFNLAGSESGEKSKWFQFFVYISQLFVYKTRLWT